MSLFSVHVRTCLHGGHTEVVVELVNAKANLDLQDKVCHYSVYMYVHVCMYVHVYIQEHNIVVLVIVIMNVYMYHLLYTTSVITQSGETALMRAASEGRTEVVVELVKAKANLDLQNKVYS